MSIRFRWRQRRHSNLLLLHIMIFIIVTIGPDSRLSSSCIQRWRGQHPACRGGFGGGSGVTPTCCSSLHDLHQRHDRPRLWPFFLMHPALTRTTSDTLMWLRQRQLDLLLLLFFITSLTCGSQSQEVTFSFFNTEANFNFVPESKSQNQQRHDDIGIGQFLLQQQQQLTARYQYHWQILIVSSSTFRNASDSHSNRFHRIRSQ